MIFICRYERREGEDWFYRGGCREDFESFYLDCRVFVDLGGFIVLFVGGF